MAACKLSKATIDALPSPKDVIWWDAALKGFGLKVTPAGRRVFLVQYRPAGDRRNPASTPSASMGGSRPIRPVPKPNASWPSEQPAATPRPSGR
jgi:hypothetical protein